MITASDQMDMMKRIPTMHFGIQLMCPHMSTSENEFAGASWNRASEDERCERA